MVSTFQNGLANGKLINKTRKPLKNFNEMFTIANSMADGEEAKKEQLNEFKARWKEESRSRPRAREVEICVDRPESSCRGEQCGRKRKMAEDITIVQ